MITSLTCRCFWRTLQLDHVLSRLYLCIKIVGLCKKPQNEMETKVSLITLFITSMKSLVCQHLPGGVVYKGVKSSMHNCTLLSFKVHKALLID